MHCIPRSSLTSSRCRAALRASCKHALARRKDCRPLGVPVRSIGFERLDKDVEDDDEFSGVKALQPIEEEDLPPINPDEDDPDIAHLLSQLQKGELPNDIPVGEGEGEDMEGLEGLSPEEVRAYKEMEEAMKLKSEILIALLRSGSQAAEKVEEVQDEIDPMMLQLLEGRIQTAVDVGESPGVVEEMRALLRLLKRTMQRRTASAALRLLDDLLAVLGDSIAGEPEYPPRRLEAMNRMREAFTGQASGVDIFEAAAALAEDSRAAGELLTTEFVFLEDFMGEVLDLLNEVQDVQRQLADAIRQRAAVLKEAKEKGQEVLSSPKIREVMKELETAKDIFSGRKRTLQQIQDILIMARELEIQTSPARQMMRGQMP